MMQLYSYFRSSTAYRVRIALNLKGVAYDVLPVNLLKNEQRNPDFLAINPLGGVPVLQQGDFCLTQSIAIMEYLDDIKPEPRLIPDDPRKAAYVRQIALSVAEDIHPLINIKTQKYLSDYFGVDEDGKKEWYRHWTRAGLSAIEMMLDRAGYAGDFVLGNHVSMADICLIPQLYSMRRFEVDLAPYPMCQKIELNCLRLPAFQNAAPEVQIDAPSDLMPIHGKNSPLLKAA